MVMSILSAVCAGVLLIMSSLGWTIHSSDCNFNYSRCSVDASVTSYVMLILMGLIMLIVAIVSAALTCRPLCCLQPNHYNHYQPGNLHFSQPNYVGNQPNYDGNQPNYVGIQPNEVNQVTTN